MTIVEGHHAVMTLPEAVQLEFGRAPLSALQKTGRKANAPGGTTTRSKKTAASNAENIAQHKKGKTKRKPTPLRKTTNKRRVVEMEADDEVSDALEQSEVVLIRKTRKVAPVEPMKRLYLLQREAGVWLRRLRSKVLKLGY